MLSRSKVQMAFLILYPFFILTQEVLSQITITANDLLNIRGKTLLSKIDTTVMVNIGSAGANQFWDFSSAFIPYNPEIKQEYFAPQEDTLFKKDFPQAHLLQKVSFISVPDSVAFTYFFINDTTISNLGTGIKVGNIAFPLLKWYENRPSRWPLPLRYANRWANNSYADVFLLGFPIGFMSSNSSFTVDAWGTITLPGASNTLKNLDCLRICSYDTTVINTSFYKDTTKTISYTWVSPKYYVLAKATSKDEETNPMFTVAGSLQRVDVKTKSEYAAIPTDFELFQNFPNPFNPTTTFRYSLPKAARVTLRIYNLLGSEVATLANDELKATGYHSAIWDGRNDAGERLTSGVYFMQMRAGAFVQTRKMLLIE